MFETTLETAHLHGALVEQFHHSGCSFCDGDRQLSCRSVSIENTPRKKMSFSLPFSSPFNITSTIKLTVQPEALRPGRSWRGCLSPSSQGDLFVLYLSLMILSCCPNAHRLPPLNLTTGDAGTLSPGRRLGCSGKEQEESCDVAPRRTERHQSSAGGENSRCRNLQLLFLN